MRKCNVTPDGLGPGGGGDGRGIEGKAPSCSDKNGGKPLGKQPACGSIGNRRASHTHTRTTHTQEQQAFLRGQGYKIVFSPQPLPFIASLPFVVLLHLLSAISPPTPLSDQHVYFLYYSFLSLYPKRKIILREKRGLIWFSNDIILCLFKASHLTFLNLNSHICKTDDYLHISQACWVKQL